MAVVQLVATQRKSETMGQAGTPQPGEVPKAGRISLLDPQQHDGPHPLYPQAEGPEIEEIKGQPTGALPL